jgi:beta-glucosidase
MKKYLLITVFALASLQGIAQIKPMKEFVDDLMLRMTVKDKIGQLNLLPAGDIMTGISTNSPIVEAIVNNQLGAILNLRGVKKIRPLQELAVKKSRLGIPLLIGLDVIHGYETIFPIPLAMSCSWDIPAIQESAHIAAKEASADGICWTFSPMVDIALDARWGRMAEGSGEDPFLGSCIAKAMVRGYQGDFLQDDNIMACVKHFALYGGAEAGRDYNTVDMSHTRMYNQYFPPYKAAVEAGAGSVMTSFNVVDFIPATANQWLIGDVLRKQWKFNGFVVTDYGSIYEMTAHGVGNIRISATKALQAGTDMDMCSEAYTSTLEKSLEDGLVSTEAIDNACRRVLEAKYKLGLFENPYKYCNPKRRATDIYTPENRRAARNLAAESFVLLKNDNNILPLKKQGKIALIGPLADSKSNVAGPWSVASTNKYRTLREGMMLALKDKAELLYAQGCNISRDSVLQKDGAYGRTIQRGDDTKMKKEALDIAHQADVIVCAMGEEEEMSGESSSRSNLELFDVQHELLSELITLKKPVVLLNYSGRATVLSWEALHVSAIMNVWFGGSESADAICDVLFGDKVPCGKLTVSMPQSNGQIPIYYNHLPTGRPVEEGSKNFRKFKSNYFDVRNDPLYPFGYGLSYSTFRYSDFLLSDTKMSKDGNITAYVRVANTGNYDADEIVQLYIHDMEACISRPIKELKGFQRIHLAKGESKILRFSITPDMLKFIDNNLNEVLESGEFEVMVGSSSRDKDLQKLSFELM